MMCVVRVRVRQTGAVRKIRNFSICAAMHTSAAPACIKRTLCEWAFNSEKIPMLRQIIGCYTKELST